MVTSSSLCVFAVVQRHGTEEQIATPDGLCTSESTDLDGEENYGVARRKAASPPLSLSLCLSLFLPNVHLGLFLLMKCCNARKEGRKKRRKGGRKFTRQRMTRY